MSNFLSSFKKSFSTQTYKQNTLINPNFMRVYNKVKHLGKDDLLRCWSVSAVSVISQHTAPEMLFGNMSGSNQEFIELEDGTRVKTNPIKEKVEELNYEKVFEIFKFTAGFFLAAFLQDKQNVWLLEKVGSDAEKFKDDVFFVFEFNTDDKNTYNEFSKKLAEEQLLKSVITIHKKILKNMLGSSESNNIVTSTTLSSLLTNGYQIFEKVFSEETNDLRRRLILK